MKWVIAQAFEELASDRFRAVVSWQESLVSRILDAPSYWTHKYKHCIPTQARRGLHQFGQWLQDLAEEPYGSSVTARKQTSDTASASSHVAKKSTSSKSKKASRSSTASKKSEH